MTRTAKIWAVLGAVAATTLAGWLLVVTAVYALGGLMTVRVVDRSAGFDLYLPVPMAVVDAALASAAIPAVYTAGLGGGLEVDGLGVDLGEVGPVLVGLLGEIDELPDATLVEVIDGRERVRVSKAAGKLRIEIEEPGTSIDVAIPARALARLADRVVD